MSHPNDTSEKKIITSTGRVIIIGNAKPLSHEVFMKTEKERERLKAAKASWYGAMRRNHPTFTKRNASKFSQKGLR